MKINYSIGVVVYDENEKFSDKVKLLTRFVSKIYIFDNSPSSKNARNYLKDSNEQQIKYLTCGKNIGLGVAMSTLCSQAYYDGFDRLLFLDQDTSISKKTLDFIEKINNNFDFESYLAISFSNDKINLKNIILEKYIFKDVKIVRNSGTLFNLGNLKKINWFNTNYFVDGVDYEFSFNASLYNLKLGLIKGVPDFDHLSEQDYQNYYFFGKKIFFRDYNASRIFDIIKSSLKLIIKSLIKFKFDYALLFSKCLITFLFTQVIIRISRKGRYEK